MLESVQDVITRLQSNTLSLDEIVNLLESPAGLVRVNAIQALATYVNRTASSTEQEKLIAQIADVATAEQSALRLMGSITIRHVAIGCLLRLGLPSATVQATQIVNALDASEKQDVAWYLNAYDLVQNHYS